MLKSVKNKQGFRFFVIVVFFCVLIKMNVLIGGEKLKVDRHPFSSVLEHRVK